MLEIEQYTDLFRRMIETDNPDGSLVSQSFSNDFLHRILVTSPKNAADCHQILEQLRETAVVIAKFEDIDTSLETQLLNYLCGGVYVLRGRAVRISTHVVVFMSEEVENITK